MYLSLNHVYFKLFVYFNILNVYLRQIQTLDTIDVSDRQRPRRSLGTSHQTLPSLLVKQVDRRASVVFGRLAITSTRLRNGRLPACDHQRQWTTLRDTAEDTRPVSSHAARRSSQTSKVLGLSTERVLSGPTSADISGCM